MRKPRSYGEVYNDLDGEIVNVFRVLRDARKAAKLQKLVKLTPFSREEFDMAYTPDPDPIEQARRTIVKAFMGFGSAAVTQVYSTSPGAGFKATTGFRANSNRSGTTPSHDWANLPRFFKVWTERLQCVVVENRPAETVMIAHDSTETLHYVDPPYVHSTRALSKHRTPQSYRFEMSEDDHAKLAETLHSLKGMVVISGYECELYEQLFRGWRKETKASHADGAKDRVEVVWLNPAVSEQLIPSLFQEAI